MGREVLDFTWTRPSPTVIPKVRLMKMPGFPDNSAFVQMSEEEDAKAAIEELNGADANSLFTEADKKRKQEEAEDSEVPLKLLRGGCVSQKRRGRSHVTSRVRSRVSCERVTLGGLYRDKVTLEVL